MPSALRSHRDGGYHQHLGTRRADRAGVDKVAIANPLKVKAIAEAKTKTDKVDAEVLAQLLRCDFLPQVWIPDKRTRLLREMCAHRAGLIADQTRIKNRIQSLLAQRQF